MLQDLRYAFRALARNPGFAMVAILTLALGIGANTAIFSVLDAALLRTLAIERPDRLVRLETSRSDGSTNMNFSAPTFRALRVRSTPFSGLVGVAPSSVGIGTRTGATQLPGEFVSPDYFTVIGVPIALGRGFTEREHATGARVVVLAHDVWRERFASDPAVLGRTVGMNSLPFTVVGVAPASYAGITWGQSSAFWAPLGAYAAATGSSPERFDSPGSSWLYLFGRLAPGVTLEQAQASLASLDPGLHADGLRFDGEETVVQPAPRGLTWAVDSMDTPLALLMGAVALVLLIACANVAGLLLARARARSREMAVRLSIGASRRRLARQLLTESAVLGLLGGALGLLFAFWLADALLAFRPAFGDPLTFDVTLDARVLAFTAGASFVTALVFGFVPVLTSLRTDLVAGLKEGGGGNVGVGRRRFGLRDGLVAGQIALSLVLLVGAGLLLRSVRNLEAVDLRFDVDNALLLSVDTEAQRYESERGLAFFSMLAERVEALPGAVSAAWARTIYPTPAGSNLGGVALEGYEPAPNEEISFDINVVSVGYFETLGMPLLRGRTFEAADRAGAARVAIINRTMAERFWPDGDALGRRIETFGCDGAPCAEIIGIAPDTKYRGLREGETNNVYVPLAQNIETTMTLLVRTRGEPLALLPAVSAEIRALDAGLPVFDAKTLRQHVALASSREQLVATLTAVFGLLALLLAGVGLYGTLAYFVSRRTRELGVRMALGAERGDVVRLVLRGALIVVAAGLALGVPAALLATRFVDSLLFGVPATDTGTMILAASALTGVALLAVWLPARRAARIQPMQALRYE